MNTDRSNVLQEASAVVTAPLQEQTAEAVLAERLNDAITAERIAAAPLFIP